MASERKVSEKVHIILCTTRNFNEDKIYEAFPNRKDSVYAKSIKFIVPLSGMTQPSPERISWKNYMFVSEK